MALARSCAKCCTARVRRYPGEDADSAKLVANQLPAAKCFCYCLSCYTTEHGYASDSGGLPATGSGSLPATGSGTTSSPPSTAGGAPYVAWS